jgi:hypothetical protein
MVSEKDFTEERKNRLKDWITIYRMYPSFFIEHALKIPLYEYQRYWLNLMAQSVNFIAVASRASAKSMLIAMFICAKCILYPGTIVTIASSTKKQAGLIITEKVTMLRSTSYFLSREIENIVANNNEYKVTFHNGSYIEVVVSGEGARGRRNSVSILEERRLIPNEVIDTIIRPFAVSRRPPYTFKDEYKHLPPQEPQEFSITSAYYKTHEWFKEAKKLFKMMADGVEDVNCLTLDYLISIKHGIKTERQIELEKQKMDEISFMQEYENIPYSGGSSSFFKLSMFYRNIKKAWLPIHENYLGQKNPYDIKKKSDEYRIVSVDMALRAGKKNDLTAITCARLFPTRKGWEADICYLETFSGRNANTLALRIKQVSEEFEADAIILDVGAGGGGLPTYDIMTTTTKDEGRGKEYPAYTVMYHPEIPEDLYKDMNERTLAKDAKPIIFPISATAQSNSAMSIRLRDRLKRKLIKFLVDDYEAEEFYISGNYKDMFDEDGVMKSYILSPHVGTSLLINECISLDMLPSGATGFKLQEQSGMRKDRFSSLMYLNWYISLMDTELLKQKDDKGEFETLADLTFIL